MGNYVSKLVFHTNENQKEMSIEQAVKQQMAAESNMCTPTLSGRKMLCDPRSASAGISRTPIEQLAAQDMCTPTLSDKRMLCDPRSISAGIARTPIETVAQDNSMCTPSLSEKRVLCDPRSISAEISRTPIEVKRSPDSTIIKRAPTAIPKYLQKKKYLETDMDIVMPPLSPKKHFVPKLIDSDQRSDLDRAEDYFTPNMNVIKGEKPITPIDKERFIILGLDPRSPAADFNRTPILMPKSLALIKARSQEMLNRKGSYELDIYNPVNLSRESSTLQKSLSIPKIQLVTDSETPKMLHMEQQNESDILCASQESDSDSSVFESEEEVTVIKNPKCKNEKEKSLISDEQIVAADEEKNKDDINKDNCKDIECDIKEMYIKDDNKIEVWYDSSKENKTGKEEENIVEKLPQKKAHREDIIIMFDECATISTSPKPIKIEEDCQKGDIAGRKKSIKIDAKVTPNEKKIFNPEDKMYGTKMLKNRTPLGNRSNNDQVQRINSPQHFLRNKTMSKTQQENTPPCKIYNAKTKNGHHWDPNTTVFI